MKAETLKAVENFLTSRLGMFGYRSLTIEPINDHDGDPSLRLTIEFDYRDAPVDGRGFLDLTRELVEVLRDRDERRFPYTNYVFDERQKIKAA